MKLPLLLATTNLGKVSELKALLDKECPDFAFQLLTLKDFPNLGEVEETGTTFLENALLKAKTYFEWTGVPVMSDDSGLVVPSHQNRPGVYSARYAGPLADSKANIDKLLHEMENITDRRAFFVSHIVFLQNLELYSVSEGYCYGEIAREARGVEGFGYDPIFYLPSYKKTVGEIPFSLKQEISHRGKALRGLIPLLKCFYDQNSPKYSS